MARVSTNTRFPYHDRLDVIANTLAGAWTRAYGCSVYILGQWTGLAASGLAFSRITGTRRASRGYNEEAHTYDYRSRRVKKLATPDAVQGATQVAYPYDGKGIIGELINASDGAIGDRYQDDNKSPYNPPRCGIHQRNTSGTT